MDPWFWSVGYYRAPGGVPRRHAALLARSCDLIIHDKHQLNPAWRRTTRANPNWMFQIRREVESGRGGSLTAHRFDQTGLSEDVL
jgi:hypothetical protein